MKKHFLHILLLLSLFCFVGCGGKKKPDDLPPLYPVKITVMQDGKPLERATVRLVADGSNTRFTTGSVTDKNGVAIIKTDGQWPGAPEGKYKVLVQKIVTPEADPSEDSLSYEEQQVKAAERNKQTKSVVDSKFMNLKTTTLAIEVTTSGATETFDVGAAVNDPLDSVSSSSSSSGHR